MRFTEVWRCPQGIRAQHLLLDSGIFSTPRTNCSDIFDISTSNTNRTQEMTPLAVVLTILMLLMTAHGMEDCGGQARATDGGASYKLHDDCKPRCYCAREGVGSM